MKKKHKFQHDLGVEALAIVTQFKGIIISRTQHLTGCDVYGLKPQGLDKDGKPFDAIFFDENEIKVISDGVKSEMEEALETSPPGGPTREHPRY